jgi:hypothetical protein
MVIHIDSPVSNIAIPKWPKNSLEVENIWDLLRFVGEREAPQFLCMLSITSKQWHEQTRPILSLMRENAAAAALGYPIAMVDALALHRLSLLRLPRLKLPPGCRDGALIEHDRPTERFFEAVQTTAGSVVRYASSDGFNKGIAIKAFDRRGGRGVPCIFLSLAHHFMSGEYQSYFRWDPDGPAWPAAEALRVPSPFPNYLEVYRTPPDSSAWWPPVMPGKEGEIKKVLELPFFYHNLMVELVHRGAHSTWQGSGRERFDAEPLKPPRKSAALSMDEMEFREFQNRVPFDQEAPICFLVEKIPQTEVGDEPLPPSWQEQRSLEDHPTSGCTGGWALLCGLLIWLNRQIKRALSLDHPSPQR